MNSQLNPNAAVFIPVSPTKLLMMDDAIISASPGVEFEESSVNLEYSSGPKHSDYFMRDNFSTIPNKMKELTTPSVCSVTDFTRNSQESMEPISIDKLLGIKQKEAAGDFGKAIFFGDNKSEDKNVSENNNTSATSIVEHTMSEDNKLSGTTTSLQVEVSCFTITEEDSHINNEADNDLTAHDLAADKEICCDIILSKDGPIKGLTSLRKKSKSSRNRYKKRSKKTESNVVENSEGFITEHRRSPPIDLTFKPIQTFSDANPFGALQTPTITTPTDQYYNLAELYKSPKETPKKDEAMFTPEINQLDNISNTPPSFILRRSIEDDSVVPFEELESPNELPPFVHPPNANRIISATKLPKSPEFDQKFQIMSSKSIEHCEVKIDADNKADLIEMELEFRTDVANAEKQETSFITEDTQVNKAVSNIELDTSERFLRPECTIRQQKKEGEQTSNSDIDIQSVNPDTQVNKAVSNIELDTSEQFLRPECTIRQQKKEGEQTYNSDIDIQSVNPRVLQDYSDTCDTLKCNAGEQTIPADKKTDDPRGIDIFSSFNSEYYEHENVAEDKENVNKTLLEFFDEDSNLEMQETSFTNENTHVNKELMDYNFVSKKEILETESEMIQIDIKTQKAETNDISSTTILTEVNLAPTNYDNIDSVIKEETKEMKLKLEAHFPTSQTTPEELRNLVQGFEVINKDELVQENYLPTGSLKVADTSEASLQINGEKEEVVQVDSPLNETLTSILKINDVFSANESTSIIKNVSSENDQTSNRNFLSAIDKFNEPQDVKLDVSEHFLFTEEPQKPSTEITDFSSVEKKKDNKSVVGDVSEVIHPLQNLASVAEKKLLVGQENIPLPPPMPPFQLFIEVKSPHDTEYVQSNLTQSMVVTETLATSPEEVNRVPLIEMTEVPLIAGSVPTTLIPSEMRGKELQDLPEMDISITATEGETRDTTAEEEMGKKEDSIELMEPVDGVTIRSSDNLTKQTAKTDELTSPACPAAVKTTTSVTKPASGVKTTTSSTTTGKTSIVKSTVSSTASTKLVTSGTGPAPAKPTTTGVATSKPNASGDAASKPASSSTVPSKNSASSVTLSKSTSSSATPSKSSVSIVAPSKSSSTSSKTSMTSMTPSKAAASSGAPSKPAASSGAPSKPVASSGAPSKPVASSGALSKSVASSGASSKPAASSGSPSKPAASSGAPSKTAASSGATSKPAASSGAPSKPVASSGTPSKPVASNGVPSKPVASGGAPSKPAASSGAPSKTAVSSGATSKPAAASGAPSKPVASNAAPSKSPSLALSKSAATSNMVPPKPAVSSTVKANAPGTNPVKPAVNSLTAAKPTATTTPEKKPAVASIVKPVSKTTTPSLTKATVTSTTSSKSVPKQLPISETTTVLKSPSKPSTPTSNPTTPTSPKSPLVKSSTIKSPPKSETKPTLLAKSSTPLKPVIEKSSDKRPATSDVKSLIKKAEPKSSTTVATKPSTPTKSSTSAAKTVSSVTKSQTSTPNKTAAAKPTAATATKQKPVGASEETSNISGPAGAKKPATATLTKIADKNSKEPASGKIVANGKTTMTKTSTNLKTDPKGNTKNSEKSVPSKKPEGEKKEEKFDQVQEHKVSTSDEITNDQQCLAQPLIHVVAEAVN